MTDDTLLTEARDRARELTAEGEPLHEGDDSGQLFLNDADLLTRLAAEVERLSAENNYLWDEIDRFGEILTPEQVSAELVRKGIDVRPAMERVRAALAKATSRKPAD